MLAYTFYETDNRVKRYVETLVRRVTLSLKEGDLYGSF